MISRLYLNLQHYGCVTIFHGRSTSDRAQVLDTIQTRPLTTLVARTIHGHEDETLSHHSVREPNPVFETSPQPTQHPSHADYTDVDQSLVHRARDYRSGEGSRGLHEWDRHRYHRGTGNGVCFYMSSKADDGAQIALDAESVMLPKTDLIDV